MQQSASDRDALLRGSAKGGDGGNPEPRLTSEQLMTKTKEETKTQDDLLDVMSRGLDGLKSLGVAIRDETDLQVKLLDKLEGEVDKGNTIDMETWHFDKEGRVIDKSNMDEDRDPKGLGKGSSSSTSKAQAERQPMPPARFLSHFGTAPKHLKPWWKDEEEVRAKMWLIGANHKANQRLLNFTKHLKPMPTHPAFKKSYIIPPLHNCFSEVFPHGGCVIVHQWFDMELRDGNLILKDMLGQNDCYRVPLTTRDETIVRFRLIYMIEEIGACLEEVCNTLQEAVIVKDGP
jgi:hypothetical protein